MKNHEVEFERTWIIKETPWLFGTKKFESKEQNHCYSKLKLLCNKKFVHWDLDERIYARQLQRKKFVFHDESNLIVLFGISELKEFWSMERTQWLFNRIFLHENNVFDWDHDGRNQTCGYADVLFWTITIIFQYC